MRQQLAPFLLEKRGPEEGWTSEGRRVKPFVDRAIQGLARLVRSTYVQWDLCSRRGLLQALDPRVKLLFLVACVVLVSLKKEPSAQGLLAALLLLLALLSRVSLPALYGRVLALGLVFGLLVSLPSALSIFTPGEVVVPILAPPQDGRILWFSARGEIGLTREGLLGVATLTSRVVNSLSVTFLVLYTTSFTEIVRGLKLFRVPDAMVMVILLTYKHLFVLVRLVEEMHLARKARLAGEDSRSDISRWAAGRMSMLFLRTQMRCEDINKGMLARGFSGSIEVSGLRRLSSRDLLAGAVLGLAAVFLWLV